MTTSAASKRRLVVVRLVAFDLRRVMRSPSFLMWTLAFPIVFYLADYNNATNNANNTASWGTPWPVYFMVSMCCWAAIAAATNVGGGRLPAERSNGWTRQLRLTPLPSWAYALGEVIIGVSVALVAVVILAVVAGAASRPGLSAQAGAEMLAACWLGSLPFAALGILVGLTTTSTSAQPMMVGTILVLNILGGLLVPLKAFPAWLRDIAHVLPTYHLGTWDGPRLLTGPFVPSTWRCSSPTARPFLRWRPGGTEATRPGHPDDPTRKNGNP